MTLEEAIGYVASDELIEVSRISKLIYTIELELIVPTPSEVGHFPVPFLLSFSCSWSFNFLGLVTHVEISNSGTLFSMLFCILHTGYTKGH